MHNFLYRMRRRARGFQWDDGDHRWMWFLAVNSMLYISSAAYTPYLTMYYAEKGHWADYFHLRAAFVGHF